MCSQTIFSAWLQFLSERVCVCWIFGKGGRVEVKGADGMSLVLFTITSERNMHTHNYS